MAMQCVESSSSRKHNGRVCEIAQNEVIIQDEYNLFWFQFQEQVYYAVAAGRLGRVVSVFDDVLGPRPPLERPEDDSAVLLPAGLRGPRVFELTLAPPPPRPRLDFAPRVLALPEAAADAVLRSPAVSLFEAVVELRVRCLNAPALGALGVDGVRFRFEDAQSWSHGVPASDTESETGDVSGPW
jgi:hypothetical protein